MAFIAASIFNSILRGEISPRNFFIMLEEQFYKELGNAIDNIVQISDTNDGADLSDFVQPNFTEEVVEVVRNLINKYADKYRS